MKVRHAWVWGGGLFQGVPGNFQKQFYISTQQFQHSCIKTTTSKCPSLSQTKEIDAKEMNKTGLLPPKCLESPEEKGEDGKKNKLLLYCWAIAVTAEEAGREESRGSDSA